jgi:hypothetical protein
VPPGSRRSSLHLVVLAPRVDVLRAREAGRAKDAYDDEVVTPELLDRALREETPRVGLWLDTSEQTPEETVEEIVSRLPEALVCYAGALAQASTSTLRCGAARPATITSVMHGVVPARLSRRIAPRRSGGISSVT